MLLLILLLLVLLVCSGGAQASSSPWPYSSNLLNSSSPNVGRSVAINGDGSVVVATSTYRGGAVVYSSSSSNNSTTWDVQVLLDGQTVHSVAVSEDGATTILGTPRLYHNGEWSDVGASWVFARLGNGSFALQAKLQAGLSGGVVGLASQEGYSVTLNAAGDLAMVSAPQDDPRVSTDDYGGGSNIYGYVGATHVYARHPSTLAWTRQQKLVAAKAYCVKKSTCQTQGFHVAVSGNGQTALVFAHLPNDADEMTYMFTYSADKKRWVEHARKFGGGYWGFDLSRNGRTIAIGGTGAFEAKAAAWVSKPGLDNEWNNGPVALNKQGDLVLVGADVYYGNDDVQYGSLVSSKWKQQGALPRVGQMQATALALSDDGTSAVLAGRGQVWIVSSRQLPHTATSQAPTLSPSTAIPSAAPSFAASPTAPPSSSVTGAPTTTPSLPLSAPDEETLPSTLSPQSTATTSSPQSSSFTTRAPTRTSGGGSSAILAAPSLLLLLLLLTTSLV